MALTEEQLEAVNLFRQCDSLKISAFAGTGKTTTLSAIANSTQKKGLYLAFNKSIASEARSKFPQSVDCRTTHSIAFRAVPSRYRGNSAKLTTSLQSNIVAKLLGIDELAIGGVILKPRSLGFLTAKTIQNFCSSAEEEPRAEHVPLVGKLRMIDLQYQAQFRGYISELAGHLWERMLDPTDPAPMGHDGYLKLWSLSKPQLGYDFVLLDEAQDTNEAVLSVMRSQASHLTLVGDRHQQIYEWRGAINAMANVEADAEAFLTRSFRFGEALADAASSILRVLNEERRLVGNPNKKTLIAAAGRTGTTLCRTNAGVISVVLDAIHTNQRPHVVGGVSELVRMLEDVGRLKLSIPASSPDFFGFRDWQEVVEFSGTEEGESLRSFVKVVSAHGEIVLIDRLSSVAPEEAGADLIVSTGHKAKGREWDTVSLHSDFDLRLSKDDPKKTVLNGEEARLLYVATTRARDLLVVPSRLAEKWNVPSLESAVAGAASPFAQFPAPTSTSKKKAPPLLPSFVKVVPGQSTQAQDSKLSGPSSNEKSSEHDSNTLTQAAVGSGIVGAIIGFFLG